MAARTGLNRRGPTVLVQCVDTSPLSRFKSQLLQSQGQGLAWVTSAKCNMMMKSPSCEDKRAFLEISRLLP